MRVALQPADTKLQAWFAISVVVILGGIPIRSEQRVFILGFDPGGIDHFAWSVCTYDDGELRHYESGVVDNAEEVMPALERTLPPFANVVAAGIDAPMFWSCVGNRYVDNIIRDECRDRRLPIGHGLPTRGGAVLFVNAMWGAVLVQGLLLGKYLHETYPTAKITEAHPVALLRLLNIPALERQLDPLRNLIADLTNEHERDATIAAFAAWSMHTEAQGWRDLYPIEPCSVKPFCTPVSYWMPIPNLNVNEP